MGCEIVHEYKNLFTSEFEFVFYMADKGDSMKIQSVKMMNIENILSYI